MKVADAKRTNAETAIAAVTRQDADAVRNASARNAATTAIKSI